MTTTTYIIGLPGQPPRMLMTASERFVQEQLQAGEVSFTQVNWPRPPHVISSDGLSLVPADIPLDVRRAKQWARAKLRRDAAEWNGCATPKGRVDTDPDSQRKVNGSVTLALIAASSGEAFSIDWTMQDNSTEPHDAAAVIAMGVAVGLHVAACHEAALLKRTEIEMSSSPEGVDVEAGWPS